MDEWIEVASVEDCPPGSTIEAVVGESIVVVANVEGDYYALDGICAHQGGPLASGKLDGCTLTCPWHGWQYDIRNGQYLLSDNICQTVYRVRESGGTIQIQLLAP